MKFKSKATRKLAEITALVFMSTTLTVSALATDFNVEPELPENQRQNGSTFFDLLVTPGQEQDLTVVIKNTSDHAITVMVEVITASTGRNGQINYTSDGEMDETLRYSFEDLASLPESDFDIPAQSSIRVTINLKTPDDTFDGAILGSIKVLREATPEERDEAGKPVSQYASVNAVRLVNREDAEDIPVDLILGEISSELLNNKESIVIPIRNTQPRLVLGASAKAQIYLADGNQPIFEYNMEKLDFAPNSIFPFSFVDEEGNDIDAGEYRAVIEVEHENRFWSFEQNFHINAEEVVDVNETAHNQHGTGSPKSPESAAHPESQGMAPWMWVAIAVIGVILIVTVVMIVALTRRRSIFPDF